AVAPADRRIVQAAVGLRDRPEQGDLIRVKEPLDDEEPVVLERAEVTSVGGETGHGEDLGRALETPSGPNGGIPPVGGRVTETLRGDGPRPSPGGREREISEVGGFVYNHVRPGGVSGRDVPPGPGVSRAGADVRAPVWNCSSS